MALEGEEARSALGVQPKTARPLYPHSALGEAHKQLLQKAQLQNKIQKQRWSVQRHCCQEVNLVHCMTVLQGT